MTYSITINNELRTRDEIVDALVANSVSNVSIIKDDDSTCRILFECSLETLMQQLIPCGIILTGAESVTKIPD